MTSEREIIVAIEFGSSKIRGIAGCKNLDGSVQVLDIAQKNARHCIRKGVIYNVDKTVLSVKAIVEELEKELGEHISQVYVGVGGRSLQTKRNTASRQLETKVVISSDLVDSLAQSNEETTYSGYEILQTVAQEYRIGTDLTVEPVGVLSNQIEARYVNVIARKDIKEYLTSCVEKSGVRIAGYFVAPMVLADCILTESERRSGCVLVDFGADLTTVSVYKNNILRHLVSIPLGGNNITTDIASLQIEEDEAEELKLKYGMAYTDFNCDSLEKNILVNNVRTIEEREMVEIVEARMEEILDNVWQQICLSGFRDKLNAGMVITGGASNIKNLDQAIQNRMGVDKLRVARIVPVQLQFTHVEQLEKDGTLNTLIALLNAGSQPCTIPFETEEPKDVVVEEPVDEEVKELKEEPKEQVKIEEEVPEEPIEPVKSEKKPGFFSKIVKKLGELTKEMVDEE